MICNNIVGVLFVPVVIGLIEPLRYGIWITIQSTLNWFNLFDLGLGGGLRTRLAQALANNDDNLARRYISTGYAFLITLVTIVSVVFIISQRWISWVKVFNAPTEFASELNLLMIFVVLFFLTRLILQLINSILIAFQMTFVSSMVNFTSHLGSLLVILFLFKKITPSLFLIGFVYTLSPLILVFISTVYFYTLGRLKGYRPSFRCIDFSCLKPIMNLGAFEFVDRISFIIIMSATNLIISHVGSPKDVVPYSVTMRFLGFFVTSFTIATEPMTPAFTEAYTKNDEPWVKRVIHKINATSIAAVIIIFVLIPFLKPIIEFVLRGKVSVPYSVIFLCSILVSNRILSVIFGRFLTGIGKLRLMVLTTAFSATIYLPIVRVFSKYFVWGVLGVIAAQICVELPIAFVKYLQTKRVITHTATGLWNK